MQKRAQNHNTFNVAHSQTHNRRAIGGKSVSESNSTKMSNEMQIQGRKNERSAPPNGNDEDEELQRKPKNLYQSRSKSKTACILNKFHTVRNYVER